MGRDDQVGAAASSTHIAVVQGQAPGTMTVRISGRLDQSTLPAAWEEVSGALRRQRPTHVVIDGSGLDYCDGAGLGLFAEVRRLTAEADGRVDFTGLSENLQRLLDASALEDPRAAVLAPLHRAGMATRLGQGAVGLLRDLRDLVAFTGEIAAGLAWAATHPHRVRGGDLWLTAEKAGVNALPVVCLLGALIGLIIAFQTAVPLQRYGAVSIVPMLVGISIARELGPLITAIILAGRSGSAFAAELGTMKVTEEIDALTVLGLDPVRYLAVPRVLAAMIVTPVLTVFNILLGILCGHLVTMTYGYSFRFYVNAVTGSLTYGDLLGGVLKTIAFGLVVGSIGCLQGLRTGKGPSAVGDSTTRSVVAGIVLIIVVDMIFGVIYFSLGI